MLYLTPCFLYVNLKEVKENRNDLRAGFTHETHTWELVEPIAKF